MLKEECSDVFYQEFFSQREAFEAVDAENLRRRERIACGLPVAGELVDGLPGLPTHGAHKRLRRMEGLFHPTDALACKIDRAPDSEQYNIRPWCWEKRRPQKQPVRMYIAASAQRMWHEMQLRPMHRHVYEIIREDTPCHLYFDLEFASAHNEDKSGDGMVEDLLSIIHSITKAVWNLGVDRSRCLEMESANASKWSRHLLVCLPGHAFQSALEAGAFVKQAVMKHRAASKLRVKSHTQQEVSFIDPSVYSRNRCFRCLFCKKVPTPGSSSVGAPFALTHRLTRSLQDKGEQSQWLESLVCNVSSAAHLLRFGNEELSSASALLIRPEAPVDSRRAAAPGQQPATAKAPSSLQLSTSADHHRLSHFTFVDVMADVSVPVKWLAGSKPSPEKLALLKRAAPDLLDLARQLLGYDINVCPRTWLLVRKVCVLNAHGLVSVDLCAPPGSHAANYCIWEGRFHKSNFSMLKADFWYGTFTLHCWDPECRKKHAWEWYVHPFAMPVHLQCNKVLFDEPPKLDQEELQDLLVYADGSRDHGVQ